MPRCVAKFGKNFCGGPGGIIPPGGGLEAAAHKVFLLTLILLPPKGDLGAQPQGFDFVFLSEGHPVDDALQARTKTLGALAPKPP
ncbi:MAG: hypothetical protein HW380_2446 [Magnetococcales bacterium]|nr:hypothetical protein [Magnetococcales bacterium]